MTMLPPRQGPIKIPSGVHQPKRAVGGIYRPLHTLTLDEIKRFAEAQLKRNLKLAAQQQLQAEIREEQEKGLRDTRPLFYLDQEDPEWPILMIGGGEFRGDLADHARKRRERPRFQHERPVRDPNVALRQAVDMRFRSLHGVRTFHIPNNPLAKE